MNFGESKHIFYFSSEGKTNLLKTVELAAERCIELSIKNIIVFTSDGEGAFALRDTLNNYHDFNIHAATFPYKQVFFTKTEEGGKEEIVPKTSLPEVRDRLSQLNINLIQGIMPLQDITIPNAKDVKIQAINHTLRLFSGGINLCIQAILMAADGGHIEPDEDVISLSADTAIVAKSCLSTYLFHPAKGMEIKEIICKPSTLTITRKKE